MRDDACPERRSRPQAPTRGSLARDLEVVSLVWSPKPAAGDVVRRTNGPDLAPPLLTYRFQSLSSHWPDRLRSTHKPPTELDIEAVGDQIAFWSTLRRPFRDLVTPSSRYRALLLIRGS